MNFKEQKNFHIPIYLLKNTVFSQKNCFYRKITNLSTFVETSSIETKKFFLKSHLNTRVETEDKTFLCHRWNDSETFPNSYKFMQIETETKRKKNFLRELIKQKVLLYVKVNYERKILLHKFPVPAERLRTKLNTQQKQ